MKWIHNDEDHRQWEAWTLVGQHPESNNLGEILFVIDFQRGGIHKWEVRKPGTNMAIGYLPYDTPEEELKALAIAMWRLG